MALKKKSCVQWNLNRLVWAYYSFGVIDIGDGLVGAGCLQWEDGTCSDYRMGPVNGDRTWWGLRLRFRLTEKDERVEQEFHGDAGTGWGADAMDVVGSGSFK